MDKRLLIAWVNAGQFHAPNDWKPSGIEHRIMREAGLTKEVKGRDPDGIGETMVKVANIVACEFPDEVRVLHEHAKSGFRIAHVKAKFNLDTRRAHRMIDAGYAVMLSGYLVIKSISYVNERSR